MKAAVLEDAIISISNQVRSDGGGRRGWKNNDVVLVSGEV
jgi:hypothetical protein